MIRDGGPYTNMIILDEVIQVGTENLSIRIPVTREVFAQPEGRRALADRMDDVVRDQLAKQAMQRGEPFFTTADHMLPYPSLAANQTYRALREGRDPRTPMGGYAAPRALFEAEGFELAPYQREYLARLDERAHPALEREPVRFAPLDDVPGPYARGGVIPYRTAVGEHFNWTRTNATHITWVDDGVENLWIGPPNPPTAPEKIMDDCACGDAFDEDGEPTTAWEHGPDECTYIERPVSQYIDHGRD